MSDKHSQDTRSFAPDKQANPCNNLSQYKAIKIRKKWFNWKSTPFPISKIEKPEVNKLFQRYLGLEDVIAPPLGFYRVYVGEGNNSSLILRTLKAKGYWTAVDSVDDNPHFVWTQSSSKKFCQQLTQRY